MHGQRQTATLTTPNGTTKWWYGDYQVLGNNTQPSFVPQTIRQLDPATGNPTSEEFHYSYDNVGRLVEVAFAQSPNPSMTQANANATGSFYDTSSNLPVSRARAEYLYDSGGRISSVANYWDTLSGTSYSSTMINGNLCGYEVGTGLNRGLKTSSQYYLGNTLQRTETYGYDADRDYLTSANYGDGLANANVSWTYDAAGNRASDSANPGAWSYDNLNRIVSSPMGSYTHDTLGNRLTGPAGASMTWDVIGRMTGFNNGTDATSYLYRADGLRVAKTGSAGTSRYFYDGQMSTETSELVGAVTTVTQNAVGGRGIERIAKTVGNGSTSYAYPMYDAHGNMIATLSRSGTGYSVAGQRSYDAWGGIRSGAGADEGYCASLGHKLDSESGLTYMRARYYEASTGRFVSQDKAWEGANWYIYAASNPLSFRDFNGKELIGPLHDLIETWLEANGIKWEELPYTVKVSAAIVDSLVKIASFYGLAMGCLNGLAYCATGAGAGVFTGNPLLAGLCGVGVVACGLGYVLCSLTIAVECRNLLYTIYLYSIDE